MPRQAHHRVKALLAERESGVDRPDWMAEGACLDYHPDLWFADMGNATTRAKEICFGCPVMDQCLQWAVVTNEPDGVWGGYSPKERANLRRAAQYQARKESVA